MFTISNLIIKLAGVVRTVVVGRLIAAPPLPGGTVGRVDLLL